MANPVRVLVVDDHPLVRKGTSDMILASPEIQVVGEAVDGFDAVVLARRLAPDVILMDVAMPDLTGIEAARRILRDLPDTRIVMLTVHDDPEYVMESIRAGAAGYLLKSVEEPELIEAVLTAAAGGSVIDEKLAAVVTDHLGDTSVRNLSPRQTEVLELVAAGLHNREIGERLGLSARTVEVHLRNAFDRLGVSSRTEAVIEAMRRGWLEIGK